MLAALGLAAAADTPGSDGATWMGSFTWTMKNDRFGGMSAIEVEPDGAGFVALSDRGTIVRGRLDRDAGDRIIGIAAGPLAMLRGRDEAALPPARADAEGLAIAPDGAIYVAFEIAPRLLRYARLSGPSEILPIPRDFNRMPFNKALEALAIAPDGALYTMPEVSLRNDGAFTVYRFRNGRWDQPFLIPPEGAFLPVGADFGPDGRFYLLERDLGVTGFSSRVRRFVLTGDGIDAGETVLQTETGAHGNLEGIGVWRDHAGRLRLTMIADDNFRSFLLTQIVEYAVRD